MLTYEQAQQLAADSTHPFLTEVGAYIGYVQDFMRKTEFKFDCKYPYSTGQLPPKEPDRKNSDERCCDLDNLLNSFDTVVYGGHSTKMQQFDEVRIDFVRSNTQHVDGIVVPEPRDPYIIQYLKPVLNLMNNLHCMLTNIESSPTYLRYTGQNRGGDEMWITFFKS